MVKADMYPQSIIQARGYIDAPLLSMGKRLLWLDPDENDERQSVTEEGAIETCTWLEAVKDGGFGAAKILIAGDTELMTGIMVDPRRPSHWSIYLQYHEDGSVECQFFGVPAEVMQALNRHMAESQ